MAIYATKYFEEIIHLVRESKSLNGESVMMIILELVDIVMIANLIKMIITGSYTSFITKDHDEKSEKASSGMLKVKMSTSLIGVSSIHLLQTFINAENMSWDVIHKQLLIHASFIVGSVLLMVIEYLHVKSEDHH
jgi:uncharacterized protein (TIGR00645 family)